MKAAAVDPIYEKPLSEIHAEVRLAFQQVQDKLISAPNAMHLDFDRAHYLALKRRALESFWKISAVSRIDTSLHSSQIYPSPNQTECEIVSSFSLCSVITDIDLMHLVVCRRNVDADFRSSFLIADCPEIPFVLNF